MRFMNKLAYEKSAYLRSAAHQTVDWHPWSQDAFDRALLEDKPVFLSTGAVWCHWCHVMASESFEDNETAELMNTLFINIKLDRDERPEIDRRYQQAVVAMGGGGGWPLSVFLTPDKRPFFGGNYFPPQDIQGKPAFKRVLREVSHHYKAHGRDVQSYAASVMESLKQGAIPPGKIIKGMLDDAEQSMLSSFDEMNGGFGTAPKFHSSGALAFLLRSSVPNPGTSAGYAARKTLEAMSQGGLYDHIGSGFHRYSTDASWRIPHFEKMADDNAELLKNYTNGYRIFGENRFGETSQGIIAYTMEVLSDPHGGFYASQDADITPDDEGGYFTWTRDELKNILNEDEFEVLSEHLLDDRSTMHHDRKKHVLSLVHEPEKVAERLGKPIEEVKSTIKRCKIKLLDVRNRRQMPFVDKAFYTSLNGMLIAAYFHSYSVLGNDRIREFGVKSLEKILQIRLSKGKLLHADGVDAVLEDYIFLIDALISGYEATAVQRYLSLADDLMSACITKFYDAIDGGFFDTESEVLSTRLKRIEDLPHPSANAVAIVLLLKLSYLVGKKTYQRKAEQTLEVFASVARNMGIFAGAYFYALDAWFHMIKLNIEAPHDSALAKEARALTATLHVSLMYGTDHGRVIPCKQDVCFEPVTDPEQLYGICSNLSLPYESRA